MVRRIRSCQACEVRFVALANSPQCSACSGSGLRVSPMRGGTNTDAAEEESSLLLPSVSVSDPFSHDTVLVGVKTDPPPKAAAASAAAAAAISDIIHIDDDDSDHGWSTGKENDVDDDDENDAGSEGGDEIHCTQLFPDEEDDDTTSSHSSSPWHNPNHIRECEEEIAGMNSSYCGRNESSPPPQQQVAEKTGYEIMDNSTILAPPPSRCATVTPMVPGEPDNVETDTVVQDTTNDVHPKMPTTATTAAAMATGTATSGGDICFICGTSLVNIKRRVDHIKRCSKKHGISGRDVKANTEIDVFEGEAGLTSNLVHSSTTTSALKVTSTTTTPLAAATTTASSLSANPYTRQSTWHGDANLSLRLASASSASITDNNHGISSGAGNTTTANKGSSGTKQLSLSSFLNNPIRNLNNVLLAGARRMTKTAELKAGSSIPPKQPTEQQTKLLFRGKKRHRGGFQQQHSSYSSSECPMYKKIPGTDFVCDGFHYAKSSLTQNYFLTHFHSDHYGGIARTWNAGVIYCSLPTATLVTQQIGVDKKYLHPLPMNTPTVIASKGKPITVTLLDANHCPGAVMFLFQVGKRQILHVGDFRWNREFMLQPASPLRDFVSEQTILDDLFLDTTYCDPKYKLPSQAETIEAIQGLFEKELERCKQNKSSKTLHLFGAYTIGKEKMYLSIAERYNMKVYVDTRRYRILSALEWPKERLALLTTNKEDARVWVVPLGDINMKKLPEYFPMANNKPFATQYDRIIGYRPTGWSMGSKPSSTLVSSRYNGNLAIHSVPYSEHSSFPELVDCLACLKPQRIVPTVNTRKSDEQVKTMLKALREKQTTLPFAKRN